MSGSHWKTGAPRTRSKVERLTVGQALAQLGIVLGVVVVWGGVMAGVMNMVKLPQPAPSAAKDRPISTPVAATAAPIAAAPSAAPTATLTAVPITKAPITAAPATSPATIAPTAAPARPTNTPAAANLAGSVSFAKDIQPILERVCLKCHGGENTNAGFVVKTYADVMKGSENGPMITPGKSADSTLIDLINQGKMPKKGPKLLPAEIRAFTQWVDAGAPNN